MRKDQSPDVAFVLAQLELTADVSRAGGQLIGLLLELQIISTDVTAALGRGDVEAAKHVGANFAALIPRLGNAYVEYGKAITRVGEMLTQAEGGSGPN